MLLFKRNIQLSWKMLMHNKPRLVTSMSGVAFAVVIMFMEMGFLNGLVDSQASLIPLFDGEILMVQEDQKFLDDSREFSRQRVFQACAIDGVVDAVPVYLDSTHFFNPQTGMEKTIGVISFPIEKTPLKIPEIDEFRAELKIPDTVLFDVRSRKILGDIQPGMELGRIDKRPLTVVGPFELGPNFLRDGYFIAGDHSFRPSNVSFGLIKISPDADPQQVKADLEAALPEDVRFMTITEVYEREKDFFVKKTPSGIIFGVGLLVGLGIGVIICYQILFNEITDHLPQYATLMAVGFTKLYILGVVMREALFLSVVSFLPGLLASALLYQAIEHFTSIVMQLTPGRVGLIFVLTIVMSSFSGVLAVRKAVKVDPADLF